MDSNSFHHRSLQEGSEQQTYVEDATSHRELGAGNTPVVTNPGSMGQWLRSS